MGYAVILVNQAILSLFATGATSVFSRALGANDRNTMNKVFGNVFWPVSFLSLILTFFTYYFAEEILLLLGAEGKILVLGIEYMKILSLGFIFGALGPALNFLIRGEGKMGSAMKIIAAGTIINIALDPVFIIVFGMGIKGAAVATIIGQALIVAGDFIHFFSKNSSISISPKSFRLSFDIMPEIIKIGISGMFMSIAVAVQLSILLSLSSVYSISSNIVMSVAFRVMSFFYIPIFGISYGLQPVIGANYGAGLYERVRKSFFFFLKISSVISGALWLFFQLCAPFILSCFITDTEIVAKGIVLFRIFMSSFILYGFIALAIMLFMAIGNAGKGALLTMGRQIFCFIPLAFILPRLMGEKGVWLSYPLGDLLVTVFGLIIVSTELKMLKKIQLQKSTSPAARNRDVDL